MPDTVPHPLRRAVHEFWAPVPWMLQTALALEVGLGRFVEAAIIAALLIFDAAPGLLQDGRGGADPGCRQGLPCANLRQAGRANGPEKLGSSQIPRLP